MYVNFIGGLVRKDELKYTQNGQPYVRFTVARDYSKRLEDGSYEDMGSFFENFVLFGKRALCFGQSDIPTGTRLAINGYTTCRLKESYVNKDGVQVPEEKVEEIVVQNVSVLLDYKQIVNVGKADYSSLSEVPRPSNKPAEGSTTTNNQPTTAAKKPVEQSKTQEMSTQNIEDIFATDTSNTLNEDSDIFSEDIFADDSSDSTDLGSEDSYDDIFS